MALGSYKFHYMCIKDLKQILPFFPAHHAISLDSLDALDALSGMISDESSDLSEPEVTTFNMNGWYQD